MCMITVMNIVDKMVIVNVSCSCVILKNKWCTLYAVLMCGFGGDGLKLNIDITNFWPEHNTYTLFFCFSDTRHKT